MPGKTLYSYAVRDKIEAQLPKRVMEAMRICGWDALGVYELCRLEIGRERRARRRAQPQRGDHGEG